MQKKNFWKWSGTRKHYTTDNFNNSFLFLKFPFSSKQFLTRLKCCCTTVGVGGNIRVGGGVGDSKMSKFLRLIIYVTDKAWSAELSCMWTGLV